VEVNDLQAVQVRVRLGWIFRLGKQQKEKRIKKESQEAGRQEAGD
jgi:hypothetical protein